MMSSKMSLSFKTACCNQSLERASFYAGIYTLTFYTILIIIGTLHLNVVDDEDPKNYTRKLIQPLILLRNLVYCCYKVR